MGFLAFLILGLIAGAIAKLILPGRQGGGWLLTLLLGVVGAVLGGWIGTMIFGVGIEAFWDLSTWLLAIGGAVLVLVLYGLIFGRDDKVND
ncbi:GlsB/YeaQ/YmgE family stress response membrane protein [Microbacterium sp. NPDC090218]